MYGSRDAEIETLEDARMKAGRELTAYLGNVIKEGGQYDTDRLLSLAFEALSIGAITNEQYRTIMDPVFENVDRVLDMLSPC